MGRRTVVLDPAVTAIVEGGGRGGRRPERKGALPRARMTLELDPAIVAVIRDVAAAEGCSPAGVVNLFIADAVGRWRGGELDFGEHTRPSRGPRYEWVVETPLEMTA
jgi:hypothetical protein